LDCVPLILSGISPNVTVMVHRMIKRRLCLQQQQN